MSVVKRVAFGSALAFLLIVAAGCGGQSVARNTKSYDYDGYLGMTNTNPNLPTSPTYHNYAVDTNMMRRAVASIGEIRNMRIHIRGANAKVTVYVRKGLPPEQVARIRDEVVSALQQAVPRYTFTVQVVNR